MWALRTPGKKPLSALWSGSTRGDNMAAHQCQDTRPTIEQMRDVVTMAHLMGKYDTADWILDNYFDKRSDYVPPGPINDA